MKLIRIFFSILALFIVVCVIAISALMIFINPNKLKPIIAAEFKKQTGYDILIDGNFSWSFYPYVGVKVEHIALFIPKQITPFADLSNITFITQLSQLLQGKQKLSGDIYIENMKLLNIQAQKTHLGLRWQDQVLTLQPITASLYNGRFEGSAHGSELSAMPRWDWEAQATNIQMSPLLQDINAGNSKLKISGSGQMKLHLTIQGKTRDQIINSLNGTGEFGLRNGTVEGVDLNYLVRSADAVINKQPLAPPLDVSQTAYDSLTGTMIIKNGIAITNDLALTTPALVANGAGSINLVYQAINLQLRIASQKDAKTEWLVPIMITGDLYRPDARLDTAELNIMIAKEKLDNVKTKVKDELKNHVSGKTAEILQNLLGKQS